jgi:ubiquinone biosynthesis monooxygenase Coq7
MTLRLTPTDHLIAALDQGLRTVWGRHHARRPTPKPLPVTLRPADPAMSPGGGDETSLTEAETRLAAALMRVNHVGEVCAQALYNAQAVGSQDPDLKAQWLAAAGDEVDHLAWTEQRLTELGARPSLLNPLWYGGAFALGWLAGRAGRGAALAFVIETERQVEAHLASHLDRLPEGDQASRAIVAQMKEDEAAHADAAEAAGGRRPPRPVRWAMRAAAKVMTVTAHRI